MVAARIAKRDVDVLLLFSIIKHRLLSTVIYCVMVNCSVLRRDPAMIHCFDQTKRNSNIVNEVEKRIWKVIIVFIETEHNDSSFDRIWMYLLYKSKLFRTHIPNLFLSMFSRELVYYVWSFTRFNTKVSIIRVKCNFFFKYNDRSWNRN